MYIYYRKYSKTFSKFLQIFPVFRRKCKTLITNDITFLYLHNYPPPFGFYHLHDGIVIC